MATRLAPQRNFVTITPTTNTSNNQVSSSQSLIDMTASTQSSSVTSVTPTTVVNGSGGEIITITSTGNPSTNDINNHLNGGHLQQQMQHAVQQVCFFFIFYFCKCQL